MTGDIAGSGGAEDCWALLLSLSRDEILEVLSAGCHEFCSNCQDILRARTRTLTTNKNFGKFSVSSDDKSDMKEATGSSYASRLSSGEKNLVPAVAAEGQQTTPWSSSARALQFASPVNVSANSTHSFSGSANTTQSFSGSSASEILLNDGLSKASSASDNGLPQDQKEHIRILRVGRKKNYVHNEKVDGKMTNVLQGLELHTGVFNLVEQKTIVECVYHLQEMGRKGQLRERTYSEPKKWMRGKGRVTLQFGCCYNYAVDKNGNPPGIIRDEEVDPIPFVLKQMIKRMVRWSVLPPFCIPDSCIVNIYDEGDCIPPHIDHHDFLRPFCTVSFLTECNILLGLNLKTLGPGEFSGPVTIPLPVGSVLVLNGNGADVAKHCIPGVPAKRISITFRKMNDTKLPYNYLRPELPGAKPLLSPVHRHDKKHANAELVKNPTRNNVFNIEKDDFPPLGGSMPNKNRSRR